MERNDSILEKSSRIPGPRSLLSKLPTPSVRVQKQILQSKENTDPLINGSYLEDCSQVSDNPKKRSSLEQIDDEPLLKKMRADAATPQKEKPKNPALARVLKKKARRSLNRAKAISMNKAVRESRQQNGLASTSKYGISNRPSASRATVTPSVRQPLVSSRTVPRTTFSAKPAPAKKTPATSRAKISPPNSVTSRPGSSAAPASKAGTKRKPWDLKGQVEDLKEALAKEKERALQTDDILRRLTALESERQIIATENTHLSGDITEKNREIDDLRREMRRVEEEAERKTRTLTLDLEECRRDLRTVRKERDELDLELRSERKKVLELEEKKVENEKEIKEMKAQIEELQRQKEQHLSTMTKQETDLRSLEEERKKLLNDVQELKGNIRVFCRVRPPLNGEEEPDHINYEGQAGKSLNVINEKNKEMKHNFDRVFGPTATQSEVYTELSQLVQSSLDGYNVCVFAYGQTGSGKTYTMEGPDDCSEDDVGIIPRAMKQIFFKCQELKKFGWEYQLSVQHVEIYCEKLHDLLREKENSAEKLEIRTTTKSGQSLVWVSSLSSHPVTKYSDVKRLLDLSKRRRATAATLANDRSSRSHSVFMLGIKASNGETGQKTESTLNLIDLAGSERVSETGSSGSRLKEAQKINGSLSALSSVISSLSKKDSHVPFRNSKLTFLLMNSLGGNSKTLMVVNINPTRSSTSETINTLRFASTVNECNIGTAQKVVKF